MKNQWTTIKTNINISEAGLRADLITLGACVAGVGDWWMAQQRLEHVATEGGQMGRISQVRTMKMGEISL